MENLTIFIICQNEERIIARTLEQAAKLASGIVLVDSGSNDQTLSIASAFKQVEIFHQDWLGYSAQKNHALSLCPEGWVMSLDADEVLTDELIAEIRDALKSNQANAYKIPRKLYIGDRFVRFGGFYPDYQLRIFRKGEGEFGKAEVHESVSLISLQAKIIKLRNPLEHYAYSDVSELEMAYMKYAKLANKKPDLLKAILTFIYNFIYRYFLRFGFLEGSLGLVLSYIYAKYGFIKYYAKRS